MDIGTGAGTVSLDSAASAPMREVDLRPYPHSASSYHRETGPEHLADELGMWHVVHVPQPPQTAWVKVDFGQGRERRVVALGVKPRPGHVSHFWDEAIFQGSNDDKSWTDIARIMLSRPPQEGWTTIRMKTIRSTDGTGCISKAVFRPTDSCPLAGGRCMSHPAVGEVSRARKIRQ